MIYLRTLAVNLASIAGLLSEFYPVKEITPSLFYFKNVFVLEASPAGPSPLSSYHPHLDGKLNPHSFATLFAYNPREGEARRSWLMCGFFSPSHTPKAKFKPENPHITTCHTLYFYIEIFTTLPWLPGGHSCFSY